MASKEILSNTRNHLIVKITDTASTIDIDLSDGDVEMGDGVTKTPTGYIVSRILLTKCGGKISLVRDNGGGSENVEYVFAGNSISLDWDHTILGTTDANKFLSLSVVPTNPNFTMILTLSKVFEAAP